MAPCAPCAVRTRCRAAFSCALRADFDFRQISSIFISIRLFVPTLHDCLATPLSTTTTIDSLGLGPVSSSQFTHDCVSSFRRTMHCPTVHSVNLIAGIAIASLFAGLRAVGFIHIIVPSSIFPSHSILVNINSKNHYPSPFHLENGCKSCFRQAQLSAL